MCSWISMKYYKDISYYIIIKGNGIEKRSFVEAIGMVDIDMVNMLLRT